MRRYKSSEVIKVVVVGDTGVGKTKLVYSKINNSGFNETQLNCNHVPTICTMDNSKDYWQRVDDVYVNYRLWDTFGDHKINRNFSYANADIAIVCFSITNRQSLINVQKFWIPEIGEHCKNATVVLAGCKTDLRQIFSIFVGKNDKKNSSFLAKSKYFRYLNYDDIVLPKEAKIVATDLNILYFETSVLEERYGIDELFLNAFRQTLIKKRKHSPLFFWLMTHQAHPLRDIQEPQRYQAPPNLKKPSLQSGEIDKQRKLMIDVASMLIDDQVCENYDVILKIANSSPEHLIKCHKIILSNFSQVFDLILSDKNHPKIDQISYSIYDTIIDGYLKTVIELSWADETCNCCNLNWLINFIYSGNRYDRLFKDTYRLIDIFRINQVGVKENGLKPSWDILEENVSISLMPFEKDLEIIAQNDQSFFVSKHLMMARCDFIKLTMNNDFLEHRNGKIRLDEFNEKVIRIFLNYCYKDRIIKDESTNFNNEDPDHIVEKLTDLMQTIVLAHRFCMNRLVTMVEQEISLFLESLPSKMFDINLWKDVLDLSKLYGCENLHTWCLQYLSINFTDLPTDFLLCFDPTDQILIEKFKWPPNWYIEMVQESIDEKNLGKKNHENQIINNPECQLFNNQHHQQINQVNKSAAHIFKDVIMNAVIKIR